MQQQDNHEYPFLYQRQTCHQVQPNQATYQKRQKCQPATYLRSEERFSRNAETDLVCRLLLEKKKKTLAQSVRQQGDHLLGTVIALSQIPPPRPLHLDLTLCTVGQPRDMQL